MKNRLFHVGILSAICLVASCENGMVPAEPEVSLRQLPIINGTPVSGDAHLATVALVMNHGTPSSFCTGTLITPNYVLTAAHCISYCQGDDSNIEEMRPIMAVGIGQTENTLRKIVNIKAFHPHPNFKCTPYEIRNDIAVLQLQEAIPLSLVTPILPMPPAFDMTVEEVDSSAGVEVLTVGFGLTDPDNLNSSGKKFKTTQRVHAYCPSKGERSKYCGYSKTSNNGFIYFNASNTGTCQGDSGGPTFMTRDGMEFVVGVTSYGYDNCRYMSAMTLVSEHYDFISRIARDLAASEPEDCTNEIDDNGDDRIDCNDPYCFVIKACIPEDCSNNKDDNGNGQFDCDDAQCLDAVLCQPEDCTNGKDDNGNGLIDCNDVQCFGMLSCQPEDCANQIDDNGNGLVDCQEDVCAEALHCQPEICDNKVDDNGNGLMDCADPECADALICVPEDCTDKLDNNGNGRVDCDDVQCARALVCQPEVCGDKLDNNGNGLIDCDDPGCANEIQCQPEICDNMIDDNANGLVDCQEPTCDAYCASADACSATPRASQMTGWGWSALLGGFAGFALLNRRRRCHISCDLKGN